MEYGPTYKTTALKWPQVIEQWLMTGFLGEAKRIYVQKWITVRQGDYLRRDWERL